MKLDRDKSPEELLALANEDKILIKRLAEALVKIPQWQPIETAPRDWTHIVLFDPYFDAPIAEGFYSCEDGGDGQWHFVQDLLECNPTHWMPLPPPPETNT